MQDNKSVKAQRRIFFVGLIFGVIISVLGNLLVTSSFELVYYFKYNEVQSYPMWLACIFGSSIFLLFVVGCIAWYELKKNQ